MADPAADKALPESAEEVLATGGGGPNRKEKRKALKKLKRKQVRQEAAARERVEEEARSNDPEEQLRIRLKEQEEAQAAERERRAFEEHERLWIEAAAARRAEEEAAAATRRAEEEAQREKNKQMQLANELEEGDEWEYVEEGPAEIIWQGNEIIVKKKKVRILKRSADQLSKEEDDDRPTSNPLPPQSAAFASHGKGQSLSEQRMLENVAQQIPNFGTEQDKAHCPFHLKTGACRFGSRCSRVHFYPDKSCTLLLRNMYNGPGLAWEQDEGLEYTDEEVECCYEEFYEDVHTEFLKFGELVNFKVCKNGSHHLRGNVYVHYKSLESAILAYNAIYGRFFAGKQITCEFIGVTRWKIAICGEYMKSRFRTCSHGSACNFIHCFRNPGGDYEWADWDNPPPKYWIKKMGALFGPSVELGYDEPKNLEHEKPRVSSRKNTSTSLRRQSRRSTYADMDMHDSGSGREDSDGKEYVCHSRLPRREHSRKRKGTAFLGKHGQYEENHISEVHGFNAKYSSRSHDSGEDSFKEQDRFFPKSNHKCEEKCGFEDHERPKKHKPEEDMSRQKKGEAFFHEQGKSENNYKSKSHEQNGKEHRSSDWNSDDSDDNRDRNPSSKGSYDRHGVDAQEQYDGRYCSSDRGSDKNSLENTSCHSKYYNERTEFVRYSSQNHESHVSHDHGREGKTSRVRKKEETGNQKFSSDGSSVDWKTGAKDPGCEESFRKNSRSGKKGKHHRRKEERKETEEQGNSSDSDSLDSNRRAYKNHSRSRTPMCSSRSSRSDRSHKNNKES